MSGVLARPRHVSHETGAVTTAPARSRVDAGLMMSVIPIPSSHNQPEMAVAGSAQRQAKFRGRRARLIRQRSTHGDPGVSYPEVQMPAASPSVID